MTSTQPQTQEFSWEDEFDYSEQQRKQMASMYESTMMKVAEKDIIRGTVVHIGPREVIVNIGFKSEGIIPLTEFRDTPG